MKEKEIQEHVTGIKEMANNIIAMGIDCFSGHIVSEEQLQRAEIALMLIKYFENRAELIQKSEEILDYIISREVGAKRGVIVDGLNDILKLLKEE